MGASVLPTAIHNGEIYFLFGKENQYEDYQDGYSDFGGGTDGSESFIETAVREGCEELTGFLGSESDIRKMLKRNLTIDYNSETHSTYRVHIFPYEYNEMLPFYYNNNQRFLQKRLDPNVIKKSKIFEKQEIRWIKMSHIMKMKSKFREFYRNIINMIYSRKDEIKKFIMYNKPRTPYYTTSNKRITLKLKTNL